VNDDIYMRVTCEPIYEHGNPTTRMIHRMEAIRLSNIQVKEAMGRLAKAMANADIEAKRQLKMSEWTLTL
jgi:hypothetical protein